MTSGDIKSSKKMRTPNAETESIKKFKQNYPKSLATATTTSS